MLVVPVSGTHIILVDVVNEDIKGTNMMYRLGKCLTKFFSIVVEFKRSDCARGKLKRVVVLKQYKCPTAHSRIVGRQSDS